MRFNFKAPCFIFLFIMGFSAILYAADQSDLARLKKQIELESAILKENPNAVPSPKLKVLQKKAVRLQRDITLQAKQKIENETQKQGLDFIAKAVEYKDNIKKATDGAISVINTIQDEIDAETRALKDKINKITNNRDVYEFLSKAGNNSADAKKVRRLNGQLEKINARKAGIEKDKEALTRVKSKLQGLKTGLDAMSMAKNFKEGNYLEGTEDLLGIVKDYLPDNSGKIKALDATVKLLSETSGGTVKINKKLGKEMARLSEYSQKLKRVEKISKGINTSLKTIGYLKQAKDMINKAIKFQTKLRDLKDDGTTTEAGRNLIMGMDAAGEAIKKLAGYLPPGASDFVEFYGDAMKLPGTVNKVAKKWYKDRAQAVNVTGPLAQTKAGREYPGVLDRDPELNPNGNLGVYYDPDKNRYVLITDPDKPAIVISKQERDKLAQINSDLSAAGKKLTNSMIEKLRENGYKKIVIPGVLKDETINVDDLAKMAVKKREQARIKMLASRALGVKNSSKKDISAYKSFDDYVSFSQRVYGYYLSDRQKKRLFAKYREDPGHFKTWLRNYAKKHKNTVLKPVLTKAEAKRKKAAERAKKLGIHKENLADYFNCLCENCGGSLGGFYNPDFKGPGHGPCQCNGPLNIWKTPMSASGKSERECFNKISKMNYEKNKVIFDKWHKAAIKANAKSVAKEVKKIKKLIRTQRKNWEEETLEAAGLFNAVKALILPGDKAYMRSIITPRLINLAHNKMLRGNIDDAVKKLEIARTIGGKEKKIEADMARYKTWKKPWKELVSKTLPEISKDAEQGKVVTAQKKLDRVYYKMSTQGGNLLPPVNSHPEILAVQNKINKKSAMMDKYIGEILREITEYENGSDPKSALKLIDDFPGDWEKGKNDITRQRPEIVRKIRKAAEFAGQGDNFRKNKQYFKAIGKYRASLDLQKDKSVRQKLDELISLHKQAALYQNRGNEYLKKKDIPKALKQYKSSVKIWPDPYLSKTISDLEKRLEKIRQKPSPKPFYVSFAGRWKSNWGDMNFTQNGDQFYGTYTHDQGRITGIVKGRTMYGTWTEAPSRKPPNDAGDMEFTLSRDGRKFSGRWRYGSNKKTWDGDWKGTKIADNPTPSAGKKTAVAGTVKTSTSYGPNCKGDVFKGGHWAGSSGGSDWIEKDFTSVQSVSKIYIGKASTDITTDGFKLTLKLKKPDGKWIVIDELHNTNINRTELSGGAKGKSVPPYTKVLNPPVKAVAFRLEFYGHGWFDATDIRIISDTIQNAKNKIAEQTTINNPFTGLYKTRVKNKNGVLNMTLRLVQNENKLSGTFRVQIMYFKSSYENSDDTQPFTGNCSKNQGTLIIDGESVPIHLYDNRQKLKIGTPSGEFILQRIHQ